MRDKCFTIRNHARIAFDNRVNSMPIARAINEIADKRRTLAILDNCGRCRLDIATVIGGVAFKNKTFHRGLTS